MGALGALFCRKRRFRAGAGLRTGPSDTDRRVVRRGTFRGCLFAMGGAGGASGRPERRRAQQAAGERSADAFPGGFPAGLPYADGGRAVVVGAGAGGRLFFRDRAGAAGVRDAGDGGFRARAAGIAETVRLGDGARDGAERSAGFLDRSRRGEAGRLAGRAGGGVFLCTQYFV